MTFFGVDWERRSVDCNDAIKKYACCLPGKNTMYFEEFAPGNTFESRPRIIGQDDVRKFAELTGDLNPLHLSDDYAKDTIFGKPIAHGLLVLGVALGEWYSLDLTRDSIVAFVGIRNLSFKLPVYPGDSVALKSEVIAARLSGSRPDVGLVTFNDEMTNQKGQSVLVFERTLMLKRKKTGP